MMPVAFRKGDSMRIRASLLPLVLVLTACASSSKISPSLEVVANPSCGGPLIKNCLENLEGQGTFSCAVLTADTGSWARSTFSLYRLETSDLKAKFEGSSATVHPVSGIWYILETRTPCGGNEEILFSREVLRHTDGSFERWNYSEESLEELGLWNDETRKEFYEYFYEIISYAPFTLGPPEG